MKIDLDLDEDGRIQLPGGGWVQVRTRLTGRDKIAVQRTVDVKVKQGDEQKVNLAFQTEMAYALLVQTIIAWSRDTPVPSQTEVGLETLLDLDLGDLNELERVIKPMVDAVGFTQAA